MAMEKRRPTHDLREIKHVFSSLDRLAVTKTALRPATSLGFDRAAIVETIQSIEPRHFDKSMTSYADHRQWQDVYFVPSDAGVLYVKFSSDVVTEFLLLSFKEKDDV
jgi:motility quorum-sensing regulator / GCU-specific mRNA interferase toxin